MLYLYLPLSLFDSKVIALHMFQFSDLFNQ
jgi:hypothetical protein